MNRKEPPLERIILYLRILEKLRKQQRNIRLADLVDALDELSPKIVREDFVALGIQPAPGLDIDLDAAYWTIIRHQPAAERETLGSSGLQFAIPTEKEVLAKIPREARVGVQFTESKHGPLEAARLLDLAFDASAANPDLFLLGHGRMNDGQIAFRHQIKSAKRVLEEMNGLAIVADEVGLGKTNIAGLVLEEVIAQNPRATVLILVPANLRKQWGKFEIPKYFGRNLLSDIRGISYSTIEMAQFLLLSLDHAKGNDKDSALAALLIKRMWDLVIVDEAHECRNADRRRFRFVYSLQARRRVFLTATPIHNSGYDIFNLASLLKPGSLGQRQFFADKYMAGERLIKNNDALQQSLSPLMTRTLRRETDGAFAKRKLVLVEIKAFKDVETDLYDRLLTLLKGIYRRHMGSASQIARVSGQLQHVSQFVLIAMLVLREMASHPVAAIETLKTALRERVKEFAAITRDDSDLSNLDKFIELYTKQSWDVAHHAKSERLIVEAQKLFARGKKFVIYVNYLKTHEILRRLLEKQHPDCSILSYEGTQNPDAKDKALERFEEEPRACLVSTDAGGQGLNLQFADCVLNYDFPWNPMRVEQRIGRVDRVNQQSRTITVLNFRTRGTVEEYVQIVLTTKLKECRSVLGEFMSPLEIEKVYEDKLTMGIGRAIMDSTDAVDMRERMRRLGEDDLKRYIGDYTLYEKEAPHAWTWRPRD